MEAMKTSDLGRAGASLEAEFAKRERLKYYEAGFIAGYRLAMSDVEKVMVCTAQSYVNGGWLTGSWCYASLHVGTIVYASTRKVSDEEGYVVTETEEVYAWRQAGQVNTSSTKINWSVRT